MEEQDKYIKIIDDQYTCGFGSRLLLLTKYKLVNKEVKSFVRKEVKPLIIKDVKSIFSKSPKACVFDFIIRNNLWFPFKILQYFKRVTL
jgi:hypothetical protein